PSTLVRAGRRYKGRPLALAEAVKFGHRAFHFLAGGIGGGADALDAKVEVVRIRGAHEGFLKSDEVAGIEIEERLIECLHAILAGAGGDGIANHARFVRVDDAIADVTSGNHYFDGGDAALTITLANEALADDCLEGGCKLQPDLLLLGRRKDCDDALNGFRGVEGVQS